jgi:sortase A
VPFDAFRPAQSTAADEVPRWPGIAAAETTEVPRLPSPSQAAQALVDALLPTRLPAREAAPPERPALNGSNGASGYHGPADAAALAEPQAPRQPEQPRPRPRPSRYEEGPTEVLGPFDIGQWLDADGVDGDNDARRRGLPRRPRRGRPDDPVTDEHGADQRRIAITPDVVAQARARASSRSGGSGPPDKPPRTRGDRIRTGVRGVGQTMITLGLIVLLFVVYELWVTDLFNAHTQHKLSTALQKDWEQGDDPLVGAAPSGPAKPGAKVSHIPLGKGIANIYIPAFGPDYVFTVVEGTGPNELAEGPGHYSGSALPGQVGNFSIAGHRVGKGSPFLNLDKLRAGDAIVIETKSYWYTYRVLGNKATGDTSRGTLGIPGMQIVPPTDVDVIRPVPNGPTAAHAQFPFITLTTCHPKFSARQRLIIHGQLEGKAWPKSQGDPPALQE